MAGLNLGANVGARAQAYYGGSPAPQTATEAAFGPGLAPAPGAASVLSPTHPAGIAFWVGIIGVAGLLAVYYSLPG